MGIISYSYNKDHRSVKTTFRWLTNLTLGGSDDQINSVTDIKNAEILLKNEQLI
jgi:hypothetical protein